MRGSGRRHPVGRLVLMELTFRTPGRRAIVNADDVVDGFVRAATATGYPEFIEVLVGELDVESLDEQRFVAGTSEYVLTFAVGGQRTTGRRTYLWADKR